VGYEPTPCRIASQAFTAPRPEIARPLSHGGRSTIATISYKILVKIGPVVSAENSLIEIALHVHVVVRRISSNISGCTGPIFAIISLYESALLADDPGPP